MYENYKELLEQIDINEKILNNCKQSIRDIELYLINYGQPKAYSIGSSYIDADTIHGSKPELRYDLLQQIIEEKGKLESMIFLQECRLNRLYSDKKLIEDKLKRLKGLYKQVFYKKVVEGKKIKLIWSELKNEGMAYDYKYIENVCGKVNKM